MVLKKEWLLILLRQFWVITLICAEIPPILPTFAFLLSLECQHIVMTNVLVLLCIVIVTFQLSHSLKKSQNFLRVLNHTLGTAGLEQENRKIDSWIIFLFWNPVLKALRIIRTYKVKRQVVWICYPSIQ